MKTISALWHLLGWVLILARTPQLRNEEIVIEILVMCPPVSNNLPSGFLEQSVKRDFRKVPIRRLEENFYSRGAISHPGLRFAMVLLSLDNNKTKEALKSG